jgi:GT2 family glycosyltransferase
MNVRLLTKPHAGPAAARNAGAQHAQGAFLAFTDDDCAPSPGWLRALALRLEQAPNSAVGGRTINALSSNLYSAATQMLIDYLYLRFNADPSAVSFFASNNICVPRERFWALGGFDTSFPLAAGEDRDFCLRWRRHGYGMVYAPEALVYHSHSLNLRTFWRQHLNYGRGAHAFRHSHRQFAEGKTSIRPILFYFDLIRYPFLRPIAKQPFLSSVLLAVSQAATMIGFLWEKTSTRLAPSPDRVQL